MYSPGNSYGPEDLAVMGRAIDKAWEFLQQRGDADVTRERLAIRVLNEASRGERNVDRLQAAALGDMPPAPLRAQPHPVDRTILPS